MLETIQSEDPMLSWDELEDDDEETSYQIFEPTFEGDYAWHGKFVSVEKEKNWTRLETWTPNCGD